MKISELNEDQKNHLAVMLDKKTYVGIITAGRIARGEMGDDEILEVFKKAGKLPGVSRRYANLVESFVLDPREKMIAQFTLELNLNILLRMRDAKLNSQEIIQVLQETIENCQRTKKLYEATSR